MFFTKLLFTHIRFMSFVFSTDKKVKIAISDLLSKKTFRVQAQAQDDQLIVIKVCLRLLKQLLVAKRAEPQRIDDTSPSLIYDVHNDRWDPSLRIKYIKFFTEQGPRLLLDKESIISYLGVFQRVQTILWLLIGIVPLWVLSLFSKRKGNVALIQTEFIELSYLSSMLINENLSKLFFFCPYEKDANLAYLMVKSKNLEIIKIPSPGPLSGHNKSLLSDKLVVSNPYQFEEYESFKDRSMFVHDVIRWLPENVASYLDKYVPVTPAVKANDLAFYSHATWLRFKGNIADSSLIDEKEEEELLQMAREFIEENQKWHLTVYLHPREKKAENITDAKQYYEILLGDSDWSFHDLDFNTRTAECFHHSELSICTYSTVFFERLIFGYKSLCFSKSALNFPINESNMANVCAEDKIEFKRLLLQSSSQSNEDFFRENGISNYPLNGWKSEDLVNKMRKHA